MPAATPSAFQVNWWAPALICPLVRDAPSFLRRAYTFRSMDFLPASEKRYGVIGLKGFARELSFGFQRDRVTGRLHNIHPRRQTLHELIVTRFEVVHILKHRHSLILSHRPKTVHVLREEGLSTNRPDESSPGLIEYVCMGGVSAGSASFVFARTTLLAGDRNTSRSQIS